MIGPRERSNGHSPLESFKDRPWMTSTLNTSIIVLPHIRINGKDELITFLCLGFWYTVLDTWSRGYVERLRGILGGPRRLSAQARRDVQRLRLVGNGWRAYPLSNMIGWVSRMVLASCGMYTLARLRINSNCHALGYEQALDRRILRTKFRLWWVMDQVTYPVI